MRKISFIQPSRNNLKYLKWSYNSIRKNLGYIHEICMADDFSTDGTWEWMQEIEKKDTEFYEKCSKECRELYEKSDFREKNYIYTMNKVIGEVTNETN